MKFFRRILFPKLWPTPLSKPWRENKEKFSMKLETTTLSGFRRWNEEKFSANQQILYHQWKLSKPKNPPTTWSHAPLGIRSAAEATCKILRWTSFQVPERNWVFSHQFWFFFFETRNCNFTNPSHSYKIALILPLKKRPLAIGPTELQVVSKSSKLRHQTKKAKRRNLNPQAKPELSDSRMIPQI